MKFLISTYLLYLDDLENDERYGKQELIKAILECGKVKKKVTLVEGSKHQR
jgi:hypothetical protein